MSLSEEKKMCRLGGFKKLFSDSPFGFFNQDLHDGLLSCLTYLDSYSQDFAFPGGYTGEYAYPYMTPATSTPEALGHETSGPYCGYPDIWYNTYYPGGVDLDTPTMAFGRHGYPYTLEFLDGVCPVQPQPGYGGSLYYLYTWYLVPATHTPGHGYGPLQPVMSNPYNYTQEYCGTYENLRAACREPITMLAEAQLEDSGRRLLAATKSRIYALSESSANWIILADGLGGAYNPETDCATCSSRRFSTVRLGGYHMFTNDFDPVLAWRFDAPVSGCNQWRATYVEELLALGITKVKVLGSWNGFVFYANVEEFGQRFPSKVFWSDFNAPLSVIPSDTSLAGFTDLGFGEEILRFEPLGNQARIYTATHIFEVLMTDGDEQFRFLKIYGGDDVLKFRYSLINAGKSHYYLSETGIMQLGEYDRVPNRIEWMHKSSGAIYDGIEARDVIGFPDLAAFGPINANACDITTGWWDSERKLCWWSWPTDERECPNMSLILSPQYGFSSLVDRGFLAGVSFTSDPRQSLLDWLKENQVCNFGSFADQLQKMGIPYDSSEDVFPNPPVGIWNATENFDLPMDPDSLCARLGETSVDDLCGPDCKSVVLVLSDAEDFTLKQYDPDSFFRERFINSEISYDCPYTTSAEYLLEGYTSLVQGDAHKYGKSEEKTISLASVDAMARDQAVPSMLQFQVGYGAQGGCLTWKTAEPRELKCLTDKTAAEHAANNTRPDTFLRFPVYRTGQFLAYRFYVQGIGGGSCFSEVKLKVRLKQSCW